MVAGVLKRVHPLRAPKYYGPRYIEAEGPPLPRGPELVAVVDDARVPLRAEPPERSLDLHPDLHRSGVHVDDLRGQPAALLHLDDRKDVRLHHFISGGRVVDHRPRDDRPPSAELHRLHLPDAASPAFRAHGPRREVEGAAVAALRSVQVVPAPASPP